MFIFLNNVIRNKTGFRRPPGRPASGFHGKNRRPGLLSSRTGQVAIILIFVIAIGLIFYAVSLNFGKISAGKVATTKATNLMAARMGSMMASWGEQVFQEQLGGKEKVCGYTGVFQAVLLVFVFVMIIIFAPAVAAVLNAAIPGTATVVSASQVAVAAAVSAVASGVSAVLQATVVNPAISDAWNSIIWENLSIVDQFMESGIQAGLTSVVSDTVELPDLIDLDSDGKFGDLTDYTDYLSAEDYVSRFGWHYMERVKDTPPPPNLGDFPLCLCTLLYVDDVTECCERLGLCKDDPVGSENWVIPPYCQSPKWGLYDPLPCGARADINVWDGSHKCCPLEADRVEHTPAHFQFPAVCDPCCQPEYAPCPLPDQKDDILCQCMCDPEVDPTGCTCGDHICQPDDTTCRSTGGEPLRLAPECCYYRKHPELYPPGSKTWNQACGDPDTCAQRSPYYDQASGEDYPFVYEKHFEETRTRVTSGGTSYYQDAYVPAERNYMRFGSDPVDADQDDQDGDDPPGYFVSFRERLGRDDKFRDYNDKDSLYHAGYLVDWNNPNWQLDTVFAAPPGNQQYLGVTIYDRFGQIVNDIFKDRFTIRDTTGFYRPGIQKPIIQAYHPDQNFMFDRKLGVFSFFYKMKDWGFRLKDLTYGENPSEPEDLYECYWCDLISPQSPWARGGSKAACLNQNVYPLDRVEELNTDGYPNGDPDHHPDDPNFPMLDLPDIPPAAGDEYDWCVDKRDPNWLANGVHIVSDKVRNIVFPLNDIEPGGVDQSQYPFFAEDPYYDVQRDCPEETGGWRRGLDLYCDPAYPYAEGCLKNNGYHQCTIDLPVIGVDETPSQQRAPLDCECVPQGPATNPEDFPEDELDRLVTQLNEFISWAEEIVFTPVRRSRMTFQNWYNEASDWIEPECTGCHPDADHIGEGCPDASCCDSNSHQNNKDLWVDTDCPGSYTNKPRKGKLFQWLDIMNDFYVPIDRWLTDTYKDDGNSVWCMPEYEYTNCAPPEEREEVFPREGNIDDIIDCLKWQVEDEMEYICGGTVMWNGEPVTGNVDKFRACQAACGDLWSTNPQWTACYNLPRALDEAGGAPGLCSVLRSGADDGTGATNGFEPPFDASIWQACLDVVTEPVPTTQPEIIDRINRCNSACSLPYSDYPYYFGCSSPFNSGSYWTMPSFGYYLNSCADPNFASEIQNILNSLNDGPGDCGDGSFLTALQNSIDLARNQIAKYKYRAWFMENRVREAKYVRKMLGEAQTHIENFLVGYSPKFDPRAVNNDPNRPVDERGKYPGTPDPIRVDQLGTDHRLGSRDDGLVDQHRENQSLLGPNGIFGGDVGLDGYAGTWDDGPSDDNMSPAEQIIWQRASLDRRPEKHLASVAVYVWQDEEIPAYKPPRYDQSGQEHRNGYIHAVKVEGRIPKRCNDACVARRWPYVREKHSTFKRCYVLSATTGWVKARAIRFDEAPDHQRTPLFPDGTTIWKPRYGHPRMVTPDKALIANVFSNECNHPWTTIPILRYYPWYGVADTSATGSSVGGPVTGSHFGHAIMLNRLPYITPEDPNDRVLQPSYDTCWRYVHSNLLEFGVVSETCAEYYFSGGAGFGQKGFKLRFIPCDKAFTEGRN